MWYFRSPEIVFGEDALEHLQTLHGNRAFIVADAVMVDLGLVDLLQRHLHKANIAHMVFSQAKGEPTVQAVLAGAEALTAYKPDWIIALGGGSAMDAAKAMWVLYENPSIALESVNPLEEITLRKKARLIAIPTTSGTGSECTWAFVLTDLIEHRKLGLGTPQLLPDIAIIDPIFPATMPARITADTGFDALTQAIEGYTASLHNDFTDGLCLKAIQLIFEYLPCAVVDGTDMVAREKLHNAAALAGLGFGNSMAALAHALGHSFGAIFGVPHGRAVGLFLPYSIQFTENGPNPTRYHEISRSLGLSSDAPSQGAASLVEAVITLATSVGQPTTIPAIINLTLADLNAAMPELIANTEADSVIAMSSRIPTETEIAQLFQYAYDGKHIDF